MTSPVGGWALRFKTTTPYPLVPAIDPEHLTPTDVQYVNTAPMWQATAVMPGLPSELLPEDDTPFPNPYGIGPVDNTPESHDYGVGPGSGLTTQESQDRMGPWHNDDQGAVAAHRFNHATDRDGTWHADVISDQPMSSASPESLRIKETGVGAPYDIGSRVARWYKRYVNRTIDMHRFDVSYGPVRPQYAVPQPSNAAVPNGNQIVPPYGNHAHYPGSIPPEQFVAQVVRRQPGDWQQNSATDGTEQIFTVADNYGLPTWGL